MKDLTKVRYQKFLNALADEGLAKSTVKSYHGIIKQVIDLTLYDKVIEKDPTFKASFDGIAPKLAEDKFLELEEILELEKRLLKDFEADMNTRVILRQLRTGMRISEVIGITEDRILWEKRQFKVDRQWQRETNSFIDTKNRKVRYVELSNDTIRLLRKIIQLNKEEALKTGYRNDKNFLFLSKMVLYLKPVSYHTVRQKLKRYLKELKFEKADILSTHALRHTHASRLLLEGATMEYIAEQLGDEMETVEKIYVHVMEQLRRQNKSIVDSMHG